MVKKELILEGVNIPLSENINIVVNKTIKDIQHPDKASADYTKTITLPSSKELNKLLTYVFEINALGEFNANKKTSAIYLEDSIEVIKGYFQLKDVVLLDEDINYKGVIFGETADLFTEISDKYLVDIENLDDFNHDYTNFNQVNSWNTSIIKNGLPQTFALGSGYVYPLINYGFDNSLNDYGVTDLFPAFYKKELFDRIIKDAGYTYVSNFLTGDLRFKREVIPFTGINFGLTDAQIQQRVFKNDTPVFMGVNTNIPNDFYIGVSYSNTVQDLGGVYDFLTGEYTVSNNGRYNVIANLNVRMVFNPVGNAVPVRTNHYYTCVLLVRKNGNIVASSIVLIHPELGTFIPSGGSYVTEPIPSYPSTEYSKNVTSGGSATPLQKTRPNELRTVLQDVVLNSGDVITTELYTSLRLINTNPNLSIDNQRYIDAGGGYYSGTTDVWLEGGEIENKVLNVSVMDGDELDMSQSVPSNVKQRDFITSILNQFNLYIQPSRDNPKELIILPRDDFYTADVVDWSEKLDVSKDLVYKPMGLLDANKYTFTYDTDGDYYNKLYLDQYNRTYGDKQVDIDNDFISKTNTNKLIFASTPIVGQSYNDLIVPSILKVDDNGSAGRFKGKIRTLVYGGLKPTDTTWTHSGTVYTTYPYCGHFDDPFNPTFDNNFDLPKEIYYDSSYHTITLTDDNLYNRFHKKGIEEITDKDSKIVVGYFNLTPLDLAILDFRKQYFFKGAYFRLQKAVDYNGSSSETTKCEFLKLKTKDVFTPLTGEVVGGVGTPIGTSIAPSLNVTEAKLEGNNTYSTKSQTVQGEDNIIDRSAQSINVVGNSNIVSSETRNIVISGNNNIIQAGVENVQLINTSDAIITESNVTYINGKNTDYDNLKIVQTVSDLPEPISGIIYLEEGVNYNFVDIVDLNGSRLEAVGTVSLFGSTPETCQIISTGLESPRALLTSNYTLALNGIGLEHDTILDLDGLGNNAVVDWFGVNFYNATSEIGTIKDYDNVIMNTIGFLNSGRLTFDGTIGTISFVDTLFENANGLTSVILPSSLNITRRFRVTNSSFVSLVGETALDVSLTATIPDEGYILNKVNFSGGGVYLSGVQSTDNKARFEGCRGISNSSSVGQYYVLGNTDVTVIASSGVYVKANFVQTAGGNVERFDVTTVDNRAIYTGSLTGLYKVLCTSSMTSGNNKELSMLIFKNGTQIPDSESIANTSGSGRAELIVSQTIVELSTSDFIEVFITNNTGTNNITIENLNITIEKIG